MEKRRVVVEIAGDYCAFHEANLAVIYDLTLDEPVGFNTKEEVDERLAEGYTGYSDVQITTALYYEGKYYIEC